MARYMLTHSLLSAWLYALKENPYEDATTERKPFEEFMKVLRREPTETTEAMKNGIIFEDLVTAILQEEQYFGYFEMYDQDCINGLVPADIQEHKWYEAANKVAQIIKGGQLQFTAKRIVGDRGWDWLLYGRLDALKSGIIYDIKFSKSYERGKYIGSTQHPMYFFLIPEAYKFTYIISNGTEVWTENYRREESVSIRSTVDSFVDWLVATDNLTLYQEKWEAR